MAEPGYICEHSQLRRTCEICELRVEVAELTEKLRVSEIQRVDAFEKLAASVGYYEDHLVEIARLQRHIADHLCHCGICQNRRTTEAMARQK